VGDDKQSAEKLLTLRGYLRLRAELGAVSGVVGGESHSASRGLLPKTF